VTKDESWFHRYLALFSDAYKVDWTRCPVPPEQIEEINLARNDIQHGKGGLGSEQVSDGCAQEEISKWPVH
jgi:hypothetical protein